MLERKEISVYELLAAAREAQGTNYVKGDGILCEKRFRKETAHMVEFLIREGQDVFEGKGEYHRKFLTEKEYQNILLQVKQGKIRIKRHAQIQGPFLCYTPIPDSQNIGKNTPKRITNWEKR
ncbi:MULTISPECIES: DUF5720 family protein [Clostridia]|uniref:DUF5720 family protein n=1 Tax=Clostridia TaxID=186801 RepID=UPI00067F5D90|nr:MULTISPECIES: DUF5720 family protein [Clostridia]